MKCPWGCGWEGEPLEYSEHLATCPSQRVYLRVVPPKNGKVKALSSSMLVSPLTRMRENLRKRNFEETLKEGMEVLVDIGKFYEMAGIIGLESLFNNVAIGLLSAYKGDWASAENFIQKAIEDAEKGVETP